ncbi:MAG TPA: F0F1 ATP synthase subunit A [Terriglobales bacterium]|nr:F0F1 ATP synthase subunit A [Terriglobales bacterium]
MPEQLWFTSILNHLFAGPATALLRALHVEPKYPQAPITNSFSMELLVFAFLIILFFLVRSRLSVDNPGGLQHMFEGANAFISDQAHEIIGHDAGKFTAYLTTLGFFILLCNLLGLVPGFESPTGSPAVPLGCAVLTFVYYHAQGVRKQGLFHYLKHFAGPMPALAPLMVPIELVSHLARMLSLTVRLYANMFAGDLVTMVFFSLIPIGLPIIFMALHLGVSIIQTYVFVLLAMIYLQGAVAVEH